MHKPHKPNKRAQTAQTPAQTGTIRAQTAPNDLDTLNALRAPLAAAYGPVIISQAADKQARSCSCSPPPSATASCATA